MAAITDSRAKNNFGAITLIFVLLISLAILQDYIQALRLDFPFYLSESLVYKSFYILFLPFVFLDRFILVHLQHKKYLLIGLLLYFISSVIIHFLIYPLVVAGLSSLFLGYTYAYHQPLHYAASELLFVLIGGHFLIGVYLYQRRYDLSTFSRKNLSERTKQNTIDDQSIIDFIVIKSGIETIKIETKDILYIKTDKPYVRIVTDDQQYLSTKTITGLLGELDTSKFLRIHKSTIIQLSNIEKVNSRKNGDYDLTLKNRTILRLSRTFATQFLDRYF